MPPPHDTRPSASSHSSNILPPAGQSSITPGHYPSFPDIYLADITRQETTTIHAQSSRSPTSSFLAPTASSSQRANYRPNDEQHLSHSVDNPLIASPDGNSDVQTGLTRNAIWTEDSRPTLLSSVTAIATAIATTTLEYRAQQHATAEALSYYGQQFQAAEAEMHRRSTRDISASSPHRTYTPHRSLRRRPGSRTLSAIPFPFLQPRERLGLGPHLSEPSSSGDPHRSKRRKVEPAKMPSMQQYGRYGQIEPGKLHMEILPSNLEQHGSLKLENIFRSDRGSYTLLNTTCNLVLQHKEGIHFQVSELVIRTAVTGRSSSAHAGAIFLAMEQDDIFKRTCQYQFQYDPDPLMDDLPFASMTSFRRRPSWIGSRDDLWPAHDEVDLEDDDEDEMLVNDHLRIYRTGSAPRLRGPGIQIPPEFATPQNLGGKTVVTQEFEGDMWASDAENDHSGESDRERHYNRSLNLGRRNWMLRHPPPNRIGTLPFENEGLNGSFPRSESNSSTRSFLNLVNGESSDSLSSSSSGSSGGSTGENEHEAATAAATAAAATTTTTTTTTTTNSFNGSNGSASGHDSDSGGSSNNNSNNNNNNNNNNASHQSRNLGDSGFIDTESISLEAAREASQMATQSAVRAVGGELLAPHACIEFGRPRCVVKFDPPVSASCILLKLWAKKKHHSGVRFRSIEVNGFAGPRYVPSVELR